MSPTQLNPHQIKGLQEAYDDLEKLKDNTRGIKIAAWVTAIATVVLAVVGVVAMLHSLDVVKTDNDTGDIRINKCLENNVPLKSSPSFNDVSNAGCGDKNRYIGKEVTWRAVVSNYAQTNGIRFLVIDDEHQNSLESRNKHGLFWGIFLATGDDPRDTDAGVKDWDAKWGGSWVNYMMDKYGAINYEKTTSSQFLVTTLIDDVNCDPAYDGCYIETSVKKISEIK